MLPSSLLVLVLAAPEIHVAPVEVVAGETLLVTFRGAPGSGTDWIGLYPAAQEQHEGSRTWLYLQGTRAKGETGPAKGALFFRGLELEPGAYEARLFFEGSYELAARASFRVVRKRLPKRRVDTKGAATVALPGARFVVGEHIPVLFTGSGAWLGVFPEGGDEAHAWFDCPPGGATILRPLNVTPGRYEVRLVFPDSFDPAARAPLTIASETASPVPAPKGALTVASFNIWFNGRGHGGLEAVAGAIRKTRADIVGLQECTPLALEQVRTFLQQDPHYKDAHISPDALVLSRFPITGVYTPPGSSGERGVNGTKLKCAGVKIRLPLGSVRFFNSHLTPYPYGPYSARDGRGLAAILADEERTRGREMGAVRAQLLDGRDAGLPTFLVGDHNTPSHLDWTKKNRPQNFDLVVPWPVSRLLDAAGFVDAYRQVHPDAIARRGFTWTPGAPKGRLSLRDVHDRIDMVYFRPGAGLKLRAVQAYVFDEDPYPADHRMVVVSFERK